MKNDEQLKPIDLEKFTGTISMFGYELIRDSLLPNILGKETHEILYWAGKELARQYPVADFDDLVLFFKKACFGDLVLLKEKKHQKLYTLTGPTITARIQHGNPNFSLEAGFLAEQLQAQQELYSEAISEINSRGNKVTITLQWDAKDSVSIDKPLETITLNDDFLTDDELEADYQEIVEPVLNESIEEKQQSEDDFIYFEDRFGILDLPSETPPVEEEAIPQDFITEEVEVPLTETFTKELRQEFTEPVEDFVETEEIMEVPTDVPSIQLEEDEIEEDVFINFVPEISAEEPEATEPFVSFEEQPVTEVEEIEAIIEEEPLNDLPTEPLTEEEALHEFDALSQVFSDINHETAPEEDDDESIFDSLPSRSSRHNKKKSK
ncbi:YslB family protein [Carnobacterium gallinarum]|uniref:YslB family protein n=1 Tax=Carnobacterium gallinarum TaxID=2749 RepID=UPI0009FFBC1C|nr:YslB family protein [Carnobacterium gallinarum]